MDENLALSITSYTARRYWPERVARKCRTNRSYAIGHNLERLYEVNAP